MDRLLTSRFYTGSLAFRHKWLSGSSLVSTSMCLAWRYVYHGAEGLYRMLEACDGMLLYTSEAYEPKAIAAMREWFGKTSRGIYVTGPLMPIGAQTAEDERESRSEDADKIQAFLDSTLAASGERSLLYVSSSCEKYYDTMLIKLSRYRLALCSTVKTRSGSYGRCSMSSWISIFHS